MKRPTAQKPVRHKKPPAAVFAAATIVVFFLTLSAADSIGFVPDYIDGSTPIPTDVADQSQPDSISLADLPQLGIDAPPAPSPTVFPERIKIDSVEMNLPVQNPATVDLDKLDALLQNGPARFATSATLGDTKGNVIIFGHSSHLPIVHNKMFQAFNQVPNVKEGSTITIEGSDGKTYVYSVRSVESMTAEKSALIPLTYDGGELTIITCDTLTGKSARFVLTADYIGTE